MVQLKIKLIGLNLAEVQLANCKSDNVTVVWCFTKYRSKHELNSVHKSCKS